MINFIIAAMKVLTFQRVDEVVSGSGKPKPWFLTRRFVGAVATAITALLLWKAKIEIDTEFLTNNLESIALGVYGICQIIIGIVNRKKGGNQ